MDFRGKDNDAYSKIEETSFTNVSEPPRRTPEYITRPNAMLDSSEDGQILNQKLDETQESDVFSTLRIIGGAVVLLGIGIAVAVIIYVFLEPYVEKPVPYHGCKFVHPDSKQLMYGKEMSIVCHLIPANITLKSDSLIITFYPSVPFPEGKEPKAKFDLYALNNTVVTSGKWNATMNKSTDLVTKEDIWLLTLYREALICDSQGRYDVIIESDRKRKQNYSLNVVLHNEVSSINMMISKFIQSNSTFYRITCSSTSGCTTHHITLEGIGGNRTQIANNINFHCTIKYGHGTGGMVTCSGDMSEDDIKSYDKLICRPKRHHPGIDLDVENKEGIIPTSSLCFSDGCNFTCPNTPSEAIYRDAKSCQVFQVCINHTLSTQSCAVGQQFNTKTCKCGPVQKQETQVCNVNGKWTEPLNQTRICVGV